MLDASRYPKLVLAAALAAFLAACGGGDSTDSQWLALAERCAVPRTGTDPATGSAYADRQGTVADEKTFLRSWTDDLYLWYREVPRLDPNAYPKPVDYFAVLKTNATTASGKPKDQFHFTMATADWVSLAQSGVEAGYGVEWVLLAAKPPRKVVVAFNQPGSPAAAASLDRGAQVLTIDGVDVANGSDVATLNAGLTPATTGETHTFVVLDQGATQSRTIQLTSAAVTGAPVQNVKTIPTANGTVGYLLFNDHIATAEKALVDAITALKGVDDLVLDIRYNGGGYLDIAAELAYMIAGPAATAGKAFEKLVYNDKHRSVDPFSGQANQPHLFPNQTLGYSADAGQPLPTLELKRVYILTGRGTCSASESVMNTLRGVDVEVVQIGATTCGKPYGFVPRDNCGTTYFAIQFQGVNDKGFGDYADGFVPGGTGGAGLPGCQVADDFGHRLGDPAEGRLAAALAYRAGGACPAAAGLGKPGAAPALPEVDGQLVRPWWREIRIVDPAGGP